MATEGKQTRLKKAVSYIAIRALFSSRRIFERGFESVEGKVLLISNGFDKKKEEKEEGKKEISIGKIGI